MNEGREIKQLLAYSKCLQILLQVLKTSCVPRMSTVDTKTQKEIIRKEKCMEVQEQSPIWKVALPDHLVCHGLLVWATEEQVVGEVEEQAKD